MTFGEHFHAALQDRGAFDRHRARNLEPDRIAAIEQKIAESGVEFIYYAMPTLGAKTVAKMVPARHIRRNLEKGICFHRTALSDLQTDRNGNLIGGGEAAHEFWGLPDPDTFVQFPWDTKIARILCTAYEPPHLNEVGGRLLPFDVRSLFNIAHQGFTERTGFELRSGLEPEMTWKGPGTEYTSKIDQSPAYQLENLERMRPIYKSVVTYAQQMGLEMIEGDYEDGGQLELNWMYDRADRTSERMYLYRQICKQVAREQGVEASFMPKPYNGLMGNGCHHNLSLWAGDENVIEDGRVELHVTEIAKQAIAGLLVHTPGMMLIMGSTVNSYKRYWDIGQFAPSDANWGLDTRAVAIRVSSNGRLEYRLPDASVNPFLSHLYLLAAIEDGLQRKLDPGTPGNGPYVDNGDIVQRSIPLTLGEAIEEFRADDYLMSVMPEEFTSLYLELKEDEWARYCGSISKFEFDMYWEAVP